MGKLNPATSKTNCKGAKETGQIEEPYRWPTASRGRWRWLCGLMLIKVEQLGNGYSRTSIFFVKEW